MTEQRYDSVYGGTDSYGLHPMNARVHDLEAIKDGLREFGQIKPIVVSQRSGYVVAGNGTLKAIRALGWSHAWFTLVPDLEPADEARLLALDNKSHERGGYDKERLLDLLNKINEDRQGLTGTGWTDAEREKLLRASASAAQKTADMFRDLGHAPAGSDEATPPRMVTLKIGLPETTAEELRRDLATYRHLMSEPELTDGRAIATIVRTTIANMEA